MTYFDLLNKIKTLSQSHQLVNDFHEGDVYNYMNSGDHKYPCVFLTMNTISTDTTGTTYKFTLFYIDRLTEDESNKIVVQSTGVSVISQILGVLVNDNATLELQSAEYTMFTEKFADYCGGVFCNVVVSDLLNSTTNDVECDDLNFDQTSIIIDKNGTYELFGNYKVIVDIVPETILK